MTDTKEFRPELLSRRGETMAWLSALGMAVALFFANGTWSPLPGFLWMFECFLLFSAVSISLGNWVDRRTVIRLEADGIAFENGLRSVRLRWPEVQNVAVMTTRGGNRVQVVGEKSHFTFKLFTESNLFGQVFRSGFEGGQQILDTVVQSSGLSKKTEAEGMYYYSRA